MDLEKPDRLLWPMLKIDSHQHFWIFDPVIDCWITEDMEIIRRDFLPDDLKSLLDQHHIAGCIAVQSDQSEIETAFLLNLAENNSFIKGVVGWVDLSSADLVNQLLHYQKFPKLKGFRHILQAEEPGFMLEPMFQKGIAELKNYEFTYDILVRSSQIKEATQLVELNPGQSFVLDHMGKPPIKNREVQTWATDIKKLSANENVFCKLSGLTTEADIQHWKKEDIYPYLDVALNCFGVERVMFGSDWPVCKIAAEYDDVYKLISGFLGQLSVDEKELIWSGNAIKFYKLEVG